MSTEAQRISRYFEVYERWKRDPEGFWAEQARRRFHLDWVQTRKVGAAFETENDVADLHLLSLFDFHFAHDAADT